MTRYLQQGLANRQHWCDVTSFHFGAKQRKLARCWHRKTPYCFCVKKISIIVVTDKKLVWDQYDVTTVVAHCVQFLHQIWCCKDLFAWVEPTRTEKAERGQGQRKRNMEHCTTQDGLSATCSETQGLNTHRKWYLVLIWAILDFKTALKWTSWVSGGGWGRLYKWVILSG